MSRDAGLLCENKFSLCSRFNLEESVHAKKLGSFHTEEPNQAKAEMYKLIEDVLKIMN